MIKILQYGWFLIIGRVADQQYCQQYTRWTCRTKRERQHRHVQDQGCSQEILATQTALTYSSATSYSSTTNGTQKVPEGHVRTINDRRTVIRQGPQLVAPQAGTSRKAAATWSEPLSRSEARQYTAGNTVLLNTRHCTVNCETCTPSHETAEVRARGPYSQDQHPLRDGTSPCGYCVQDWVRRAHGVAYRRLRSEGRASGSEVLCALKCHLVGRKRGREGWRAGGEALGGGEKKGRNEGIPAEQARARLVWCQGYWRHRRSLEAWYPWVPQAGPSCSLR